MSPEDEGETRPDQARHSKQSRGRRAGANDRLPRRRAETREYFGSFPAQIVPESVINGIACKVFEAHRTGRREAYAYLKDFVLEKLEVPDWPLDPMPKLPGMTPPPLPPDC